MLHKTIQGRVRVKDRAEGAVADGTLEAVFATLGVRDHDGDVIMPGAIQPGPVIISAWNHKSWEGAWPIGRGHIRVKGDQARVTAQLFMDSDAGREAHAVLRGLAELAEFSWSLADVESRPGTLNGEPVNEIHKVSVREISPVLLAASLGTGTVSLRGRSADERRVLAEAAVHVAEYERQRAFERAHLDFIAVGLRS